MSILNIYWTKTSQHVHHYKNCNTTGKTTWVWTDGNCWAFLSDSCEVQTTSWCLESLRPSALVCTSNIEPRHRHQLNFSGHQCRSLSDSCPGEGCLPGLPRVDHYMTSALGHRIKKEHSNILVTRKLWPSAIGRVSATKKHIDKKKLFTSPVIPCFIKLVAQ